MRIIDDKKEYSSEELLDAYDEIIEALQIENKPQGFPDYIDKKELPNIQIDIPKALLVQELTFDHSEDQDSIQGLNYMDECESCKILSILISTLPVVADKNTNEFYDTEINELKVKLALVEYFVNQGADINATDSNGNTALMALFLAEDFNASRLIAIQEILKLKPDLSIKNNSGQSLLDLCFLHFQRESLLDSPLTGKLYQAQKEILRLLLKSGAQFAPEDKPKFDGNFVFNQLFLEQAVQEQQGLLIKLTQQIAQLSNENLQLTSKLSNFEPDGSDKKSTDDEQSKPGFFRK